MDVTGILNQVFVLSILQIHITEKTLSDGVAPNYLPYNNSCRLHGHIGDHFPPSTIIVNKSLAKSRPKDEPCRREARRGVSIIRPLEVTAAAGVAALLPDRAIVSRHGKPSSGAACPRDVLNLYAVRHL